MSGNNRLRRSALAALAVVHHGGGAHRVCVQLHQHRRELRRSTAPLVIGASVSLTGDFADSGKAVKAGYELWANTVNAKGGHAGASGRR